MEGTNYAVTLGRVGKIWVQHKLHRVKLRIIKTRLTARILLAARQEIHLDICGTSSPVPQQDDRPQILSGNKLGKHRSQVKTGVSFIV